MRLSVTSDDFGYSQAVNRAVDIASRQGILTSASLMVSGEAFHDAVEISLSNSSLKTGLHLALTEAVPVSSPEKVPLLLNEKGRFGKSPAAAGLRLCFSQAFREQARLEVAAQFARFAETGLAFNHVDSHHHLHVTPALFDMVLQQAEKYGVGDIRIPYEPWDISGPITQGNRVRNWVYRKVFYPLCNSCRQKADQAGFSGSDGVFGLYTTGQVTEAWLLLLLERLKNRSGVYEIYTHPSCDPLSPGFSEFQALTSSRVREKIACYGIELT